MTTPESIRAEVVECLWTVATETLHLENWTTTPTVLDCVGDLDGALQDFQDTGRADSISEAMFVLAWAVAEADGRLAA